MSEVGTADEELLARFDGNSDFRTARQNWSDEQRTAFCIMARAVNAVGLDWYQTNIPQIRFGRRSPQEMRADGTLGSVQLRKNGGFIEFSHQHQLIGLTGSYQFDLQSAAQFENDISLANDTIQNWLPPAQPRHGFWPNETSIDEEDSQASRIRQYTLERYINPARKRGDASVSVVVGPLNNEMGLNKAWPNICQALEGRKFQELADVPPPRGEGPKFSTTRILTFMLKMGDVHVAQVEPIPTNLILYGPPGTGKTYHTVRTAVALCDGKANYPESKAGRAALMARYTELVEKNQIGFVTFHQNYGYEDFVEGLRPVPITNEDGESVGFHLQPEPGIFRQIAERAATEGLVAGSDAFNLADRAIYKMSLGEVADSASDFVFTESIAGSYALLGFHDIDWSDPRFGDRDEIIAAIKERFPDEDITPNKGSVQSPDVFRNQLEIGDVLIVAKGNHRFRAIGIVAGDYEYAPRPDGRYCHRRRVNWLWHDTEGLDVGELYPPKFIQKTIYRLKDSGLNRPLIAQLISDSGDGGKMAEPLPHVLIIDEINRANVSKVFGELITLLEADKRAGMDNALSVTLPYSKQSFSVPANLHIVGTMNTADRSIALLDTALRRRFSFREMAPDPDLLSVVQGVDLKGVLTTINRRIEYLIDREHRIGHAFFINCETKEQVEGVMRDKVIPLLQEYFFEDWSRIAAVLGDGFIQEEKLNPPPGIEGDSLSSWSVLSPFKDDAFERLVGKAAAIADAVPVTANKSGE